MKILFAVHTYYPDHNGVQAVTQYISEGLAQWHQIKILVGVKADNLGTTPYPVHENHNGVEIERIDAELGRKHQFIGNKEYYYEAINKYAPDILVCVCVQSWPYDWIIDRIDQIPCKKVLYTHGFSAYSKNYPFDKDILGLHLNALSDHIYWKNYYEKNAIYFKKFDLITYLTESSSSFQFASEHHLCNSMILGNAVEDELFNNCSLDREISTEVTVYIYIANYDENKNHKMVLDAFYQANVRNSKLILIGGKKNIFYDSLLKQKEMLDDHFGKKSVEILYGIARNEIMNYLYRADIFVCASKHEEYPLMLCEAAAKGLAIISTEVGNASDFPGIDCVNSMEEMVKQMVILGENHGLRVKKGKMLREFACKNFVINDKINLFRHALENI